MSVPTRAAGPVLRAARQAPHAEIDELTGGGGVCIVVPHPDDETLGCGMALARAAMLSRPVRIVLLTAGEGSHPRSRSLPPRRLAAFRRRELSGALAVLSPAAPVPVLALGLPDGRSDVGMLDARRVAAATRFAEAGCVGAVWSTWAGDPHCDHLTAARLGQRIADALGVAWWSVPVWGRFANVPPPPGLHRYFDPAMRVRKVRALSRYRSQFTGRIADDPGGFVMPAAILSHFARAPELFVRG